MSNVRTALFLCAVLAAGAAAAKEPQGFQCPKVDKHATAQEVFEARLAALGTGNVDLAFCFYAEDAEVVLPGQVVRGREAIKAAFLQFGGAFGGAAPEVLSVTATADVVLLTFRVLGAPFSVLDGADTFVIRDGLIRTHVVHAPLVPTP